MAAVWLIVFAAMLRRGLQLARGEHVPIGPDRSDELAPADNSAM